jgi:outer membrane immunogenic protein
MKRLALAISFIAFSAATASAADMAVKAPPPAPMMVQVFSWTGFYIGGNVGGHWGRDSITTTSDPVGFPPPTNADTLSPVTLKPQGVMGGVQVGYNWQMNNVVFGIEGDANWLGGTASRHFAYPFPIFPFGPAFGDYIENSTSAAFLGTIRPRIGLTMDRLLLYVTGGVAFGSVKTTDSFCIQRCIDFAGSFSTVSGTATRTGWTAGAGVEYAIGNNWSVKAEYLYVDLGSYNTLIPSAPDCVPTGACSFVVHHSYTDNIARVGVNYRFGGPVVARY